jgi:hypothetical protein
VGFADDDENGMTGRPLRMACIGNIDLVGVKLADGAIRPVVGRRVTMDEAGAALEEHRARRSIRRADPRPTAEEWKRKCAFALASATAFDERSDPGWCQHLHCNAFVADPVEAVRTLYAAHDEEVSDLHARRMEAFLEQRPQGAFGRHGYDPADFGWTYAGLAEEFADYTAR